MQVFYTPQMVANADSFSPSAAKPAQVVAAWQAAGFPIQVFAPAPASLAQLYRAHDPAYVDDVLACRRSNGFGNRRQAVAQSLRYTSGAMVAAVQAAIKEGGITCAPVSGFHHAGYDFGGGFCTFNGLMVAALEVLECGLAQRVGILDCDMHYGNGTEQILRHLGRRDVVHFSAGQDYGRPDQAEGFLAALPKLVASRFADCDVLIYQAGADPHVNDPLGGWLTTEQLAERDRLVFATAHALGVPVAWNLAGGYQRDAQGGISPVLAIHANTLREAFAMSATNRWVGEGCQQALVPACRRPGLVARQGGAGVRKGRGPVRGDGRVQIGEA